MATRVQTAPETARKAWTLLFELARRKHGILVQGLAELDLTPVQAYALRKLDPERPLGMGELAEALYCHASNVTGIVDRLEARGLVERRPGLEDRRVKTLALTEEGADVRARVVGLMSEPPPEIAALPAADRRALLEILGRALEDERGA